MPGAETEFVRRFAIALATVNGHPDAAEWAERVVAAYEGPTASPAEAKEAQPAGPADTGPLEPEGAA